MPDLEGTDLRGWELNNVNLSNADLHGADLRKVKLRGANLRDATLGDAKLSEAELGDANLSEADLNGADLCLADLKGATLTKAQLVGARLRLATLDGANLAGADAQQADLFKASLRGSTANLSGAILEDADLNNADLTGADLSGARLVGANLRGAYLDETKLIGANLGEVNLRYATLRGADLSGASLRGALLVETHLEDAVLTGCFVYGIAAWNVRLSLGTKQQGLVITDLFQPEIIVDNLEVAQFIHLLLQNEKIRDVIDTITSKVVLILGRFSIPERKRVLDALRDELRKRNYVPVVFDFEKSTNRTTDETITLLARMARLVIADISDAKSVLQELRSIVPDNPSVSVQPIIDAAQDEPGMFNSFKPYPWFLKVYRYRNPAQLLADLDKRVIAPPEAKAAKRGSSAKLARRLTG